MTDPLANEMLVWTVHPVRESAAKAALAIAAPLAALGLVYLLMHSLLYAVLGFLLLFASEFPFFIKTTYTFDAQGATMKRGGVAITKKWDQIKSYYPDKNGVLLSPFARPMWLENFRGLYLQYGRHKEEILQQLERRLPQPAK